MSKIEELKREIEARLPEVRVSEDPPTVPMGSWFLDLSLRDRAATVEWKPQKGFGVTSLPSDGFGEGPDEAYDDVESTVHRLSELLKEGQRTKAPRELLLHELRIKLGMSQEELARTLSIQQPTLSKMERRRDILISTLRKIVGGLGGTLEISARFSGTLIQIVQFRESKEASRKSTSSMRRMRRPHGKARHKAPK